MKRAILGSLLGAGLVALGVAFSTGPRNSSHSTGGLFANRPGRRLDRLALAGRG